MTREEQRMEAGQQYLVMPNAYSADKDIRQVVAECFMDGATWADNHPNWISVEERLPGVNDYGNNNYCLVADDFGDMYVAYYNRDEEHWLDDGNVAVLFVTHWMPLPQPPRKEDKE